MTPLEARAVAKRMFRELAKIPPRLSTSRGPRLEDRVVDNPEFLERAAVLADVVLQSDRPEVGEGLALASRGRVHPWPGRFFATGVGTLLPSGVEVTELANAIQWAEQTLFPPRRAPNMPNRANVIRLVIDAHGEGREASEWLRILWREMEAACNGRPRGPRIALDAANSAIRGHGIESMAYRTFDGDDVVVFEYVNTGDTYSETVGFLYEPGQRRTRRFLVTTMGDVREQTERRFRDRGEWGLW